MAGIELAAFLLAAAANPSAPAFEFRGITAGTQAEFKKRGFCIDKNGETSCLENATEVAGAPMIDLAISRYQDKLTSVYATFHTNHFKTLLEAFTAKYGTPCETRTKPWQSRMGVKGESAVISWCFKTGVLELESIGPRIDQGRFIYGDQWQAPKAPPKVDF
jgi:hypothetical protein